LRSDFLRQKHAENSKDQSNPHSTPLIDSYDLRTVPYMKVVASTEEGL